MIYALLLMYVGTAFPHISWHGTADLCHFEAAVAVAKASPPVADAACVAVRVSDLALVSRESYSVELPRVP
jgi:hypothetical protein